MIFNSEKELVDTFRQLVDPDDWQIYPETGNFDLLLSRRADGFQIGVEAKLKLNAKVVCQAADLTRNPMNPGPDCRAVLIPWTKGRTEFHTLLEVLQIVVVRVGGRSGRPWLSCALPRLEARSSTKEWPEHFPAARLELPDYIPDVEAGVKGPTKLTHWKIKAIKLVILLRNRGYLVRKDFQRFDCSPSTWTQRGWLVPGPVRGQWVEGQGIPDFEKQHPLNFKQIASDFDRWNARDLEGVI